MTDPFSSRMAELDAFVEHCTSAGAFGPSVVRDTSNRTGREWPWWGFEIEQTDVDGTEKRRKTAEIYLNSPAPGVPSEFEGRWSARIWRDDNSDGYREKGSWPLAWETPSMSEFEQAFVTLLSAADEAILRGTERGS